MLREEGNDVVRSMRASNNSRVCPRPSGTASSTITRIPAAGRQRLTHPLEMTNAVDGERYGGNSQRARRSWRAPSRPATAARRPTTGFQNRPREGHGILRRYVLRPTHPPVHHCLGRDGGTRRRHLRLAIRPSARVRYRRRQQRYVRKLRLRRRGQADGAWRSRTRGSCQRLSMLHRVTARHRESHPAPDRVAG